VAKSNTKSSASARKSAKAVTKRPSSDKKAAKAPQTKPASKPVLAKFAATKPVKPAKKVADEPPTIVQPSVPSGAKPKKNQAGMSPKELENFRDLLLAKRRELVGDMSSMEREALRSTSGSNLSNLPIHMADMGTDNYEQEFTLGLVEKDRVLLREIYTALAKIQDGTYGICEGTGKPIGKARLEA
jgi:DnaK suppressor protein